MSKMKPMLIAIGGLSGTGKTTLSQNLSQIFASLINPPSQASVSSDIVRKTLWARENNQDVNLYAPLPVEAYSSAYGAKAHKQMIDDIKGHFNNEVTIVDATFTKPEARTDIEQLARDNGVNFFGLWLEAPISTIKQRADNRSQKGQTISDANSMVIDLQVKAGTGEVNWTKINAADDMVDVTNKAVAKIIPTIR